MNLDDKQTRMALYAVNDMIASRNRSGHPIPPGFHRFRQQLEEQGTSVFGSENTSTGEQLAADEDMITADQAAEILNCSARWVRQIGSDLDGHQVGARWVFNRNNVTEYAELRDQERTARPSTD